MEVDVPLAVVGQGPQRTAVIVHQPGQVLLEPLHVQQILLYVLIGYIQPHEVLFVAHTVEHELIRTNGSADIAEFSQQEKHIRYAGQTISIDVRRTGDRRGIGHAPLRSQDPCFPCPMKPLRRPDPIPIGELKRGRLPACVSFGQKIQNPLGHAFLRETQPGQHKQENNSTLHDSDSLG